VNGKKKYGKKICTPNTAAVDMSADATAQKLERYTTKNIESA
jgi:hypothetical protein